MPESTAAGASRIAKDAQSHSLTAADRLALSRARLREALMPSPEEIQAAAQANKRKPRSIFHRIETGWRRWRRHGTHLTALNMALELWGSRSVTSVQSHGIIGLAREHPVLTVAVAAGAGASLALIRPWRWGMVRNVALTARLQVTDLLVGWLIRAPLQKQLASLFADLTQSANDDPASDDEASDTPQDQRQSQSAGIETQATAA